MSTINEQLTGSLVNKITGLQVNTPKCNNLINKSTHSLKYDKCTSTSEEEVNVAFNGLSDKFTIKGHRDLARALAQLKEEYLNKSRPLGSIETTNHSILKYDMLQLLLSLSSSKNQNYNYIIPNSIQDSITSGEIDEKKKASATWNDILKEDPLEGDHWQTWSEGNRTDNDLSDDDGYELLSDKEKATITKKTLIPQLNNNNTYTKVNVVDFASQMEVDERGDQETLNYLTTQQYWRSDFELPKDNSADFAAATTTIKDMSLLQRPCQMSDALLLSNQQEQLKTISEATVIREVLFLLKGFQGILFEVYDGEFVANGDITVQHLGHKALNQLLNEFCMYGNIISELRQTIDRVVNDIHFGQTCQAFAAVVHTSLTDFEHSLAHLENNCSIITTSDPTNTTIPTQSISILKLRITLDPHLQNFKAMHDIIVDAPFLGHNPPSRFLATHLISTLYDRALIAQSSGQLFIYDALLYVLEQTLVPYGRIMDDWIFYGSLEEDRANEFYVSRTETVSMNEPNFWMEGFTRIPISAMFSRKQQFMCPLFDESVMERVFFTGKAVNLLSQIEKRKKLGQTVIYTPVPFSIVMHSHVSTKPPFITTNAADDLLLFQRPPREPTLATLTLFPMTKNIFRENQQTNSITTENDIGSLFDQEFICCCESYIQEPYTITANTLSKVLHKNCGLSEQLDSLASLYLMLENDLMHSFCEALFTQMDNNEFLLDKLILNRTFSQVCETRGYDEVVYIKVKRRDATQINGDGSHQPPRPYYSAASYLELIDFDVEIPWPLNNFIQKNHIAGYAKITSFLLRLKRAKYIMEKRTLFRGKPNNKSSDTLAMGFYSIRIKMLWFINSFWRYIMTTILHSETIEFRKKLSVSKDADEITVLHAAYVHRIIERCLLNEKASMIKKSILGIFDMAEEMMDVFEQYLQKDNHKDGFKNSNLDQQFMNSLETIEKDFKRANEFVSMSLMILGKKSGFTWLESLATSLSAQ